jgi:hypothetical protein
MLIRSVPEGDSEKHKLISDRASIGGLKDTTKLADFKFVFNHTVLGQLNQE